MPSHPLSPEVLETDHAIACLLDKPAKFAHFLPWIGFSERRELQTGKSCARGSPGVHFPKTAKFNTDTWASLSKERACIPFEFQIEEGAVRLSQDTSSFTQGCITMKAWQEVELDER
jgi:hypothetical protein